MNELITRFKSKTPLFFRKLRNISLSIAGSCGAATVAYSQLPADLTSLVPHTLVQTLAIGGVVAAFVAQFAKEDDKKSDEPPLAQ